MVTEALRRVINKIAGSKKVGAQQKLANLLNVNRCVINCWLNGTRSIPLKHALHMEVLVQGFVKAEELAPDSKMEIRTYREFLFKQFTMRQL